MSEAAALARADEILATASSVLDVEVRGGEPLASFPALRSMVERLRERGGRRTLLLSLSSNLASMTEESCDWLVAQGALLTIAYDGTREAHEANRARTGAPAHDVVEGWIRRIHARYEARHIAPVAAYLNAAVTVTDATIAAGAEAAARACSDVGLVYVLVRPDARIAPAAFTDFWRAFVDRVLPLNEAGTLLVEKRLALHLEGLASLDPIGPQAQPISCRTCAYDRWCGSPLLARYLMEGDLQKVFGSRWCGTSMGTFDAVFEMLRSERGPSLRRVFAGWMRARDRVQERFRS